jgi:hypothetical protein
MTDTYVQRIIDALYANLHLIGKTADSLDITLARYYALLLLAKGAATRPEDVHDAWAMWRHETRPEDPDLVPFNELTPEVITYDLPWVRLIGLVAAGRSITGARRFGGAR